MFKTIAAALIATATIAASFAPAAASNRWVRVYNEGYGAIEQIRISGTYDGDYGRDLLGSIVLDANYNVKLEPDFASATCEFDVKITYVSGYVLKLNGINLCADSEIHATERSIYSV